MVVAGVSGIIYMLHSNSALTVNVNGIQRISMFYSDSPVSDSHVWRALSTISMSLHMAKVQSILFCTQLCNSAALWCQFFTRASIINNQIKRSTQEIFGIRIWFNSPYLPSTRKGPKKGLFFNILRIGVYALGIWSFDWVQFSFYHSDDLRDHWLVYWVLSMAPRVSSNDLE